ncbi:YkvA family protein [Limnobacter parvus]|uniref:YkvA family protein n=1 Tax=Limnobacter parvus TaxID=2939690 RepID=A0ABT1XEJ1_9BURK|nr:YkvA family protein [Limnobacter parvus]MCR2745665.1 YkvA family protein [Limnobacter parvus]
MFTRFFPILTKLKALKTHGRMLWHAFRHADTPKWIKGFMLAVVLYLFSPIDLIPDFLVLFGITDDLVVISAAMWFLGKVVPDKVKNSLPMDDAETTKPATSAKHAETQVKSVKPAGPVKTSPLKPFGLVLLVGLLIAALASHPWVQAQFSSIGAFF